MKRQGDPGERPPRNGRLPAVGATRRGVLGLGAGGVLGAAGPVAAGLADRPDRPAAPARTSSPPTVPHRRVVPENSRPGDRHWAIRHAGAPHAIEGYAGAASVLTGESFPLFVSCAAAGFR